MSSDSGPGGYDRESLEFARVLTFSDGLFAIADRWKPEGADELFS